MDGVKAVAIVNPAAGSGRAAKLWPAAERILRGAWPALTVLRSTGCGHASELAAFAVASGAERLVVCGGDGTIGEVVHGLLSTGGRLPPIGLVPAGTGSDLVRTLGSPASAEEAAARIVAGRPRAIDAGRVTFTKHDGAAGVYHFVNVASLGLSGPTVQAVNARKQKGGGKVAFLSATVRELLRYPFQNVRIAIDDGAPFEARIALVAIANSRWFGGGMKIAPEALPDDGELDVVIVRAASRARLISQLPRLYRGTHAGLPEVAIVRGRRVTVLGLDATDAVLVEADGECLGRCPATFEVMLQALQVL